MSVKELGLLIGGEWREAEGGRRFADLDPFTAETVATAPAATRDDARQAVAAAAAAFPGWAAAPPAERQRVLLRAADLLEARRDDVVGWLARETGSALGFSLFQVAFVAGLFRQAASLAYAPLGQVLPSDSGAFSMALRRPAGVVGAIAPWNAALILSARGLAAPLALGNTVVLKPSEHSPYTGGQIWGEILGEAGLPPGALNVVTHSPGEAEPIATELIENPAVRRISFTGSTENGRKLAQAAGAHLKRVVLELGGYNPLIVLRDADIPYAVDAAAFGAYLHQGQICMSARRLIVERPVADEFIGRLAAKASTLKSGDPSKPDTVLGPLITREALDVVRRRVEEAVALGATVLAGARADGACYPATLLAGVPADAELAREETFGPVALVEIVESADEAVERANATRYGLASAIITSDADSGLALARRIEAGIVHVNDQPVADEPQMPFGGVKDSGYGRFGGTAAIEEFTELSWITVRSGTHPFPF